jgi:hypothetical protein
MKGRAPALSLGADAMLDSKVHAAEFPSALQSVCSVESVVTSSPSVFFSLNSVKFIHSVNGGWFVSLVSLANACCTSEPLYILLGDFPIRSGQVPIVQEIGNFHSGCDRVRKEPVDERLLSFVGTANVWACSGDPG